MMDIQEDYSLQSHNTLALNQKARFFVTVNNEQELLQACDFAKRKNVSLLMLGEGSNLVLSRDYPGLVAQNAIKGIDVVAEDADSITIEVGAGENWHNLVCQTLNQNWFGLENLALIPGTAGAAPVQNIGAYGVEICSFVNSVRAFDQSTREWKQFNSQQCQFAYRDSLFKHEPGRLLITKVQLRLHKQPSINIQYQALKDHFQSSHSISPHAISPQEVCDAVVAIRCSRLPDPVVVPNAGSFFKNPIISLAQYRELLKQFPDMVSYPVGDTHRKLAAAWLIDRAGWKGVRDGRVGVHEHQALVLINTGAASGAELLGLADRICSDVKKRYDITLEIEPTVI